jgi:uncharacterized lipoprotein YmbA
MRLHRRRVLSLAPAVALAACSSDPTQYFQMSALPGPVFNTAARSIRIRDISVPGYLGQTNIARPSGAYQFAAYGNSLWAEPLADMLQSTLVQNLTQRLPQMTVTGSNGALGAAADILVEINILRFDPNPAGSLILNAQIALKTLPDGNFLLTRTLQSSATPATQDAAGIAATMSALWAGLANEIAAEIAR